ncbi:MAG: hypothetical protein WC150_08095 [Bacteroidia bacterium]
MMKRVSGRTSVLLLLCFLMLASACGSGKTHGSKGNKARKKHYPFKSRD